MIKLSIDAMGSDKGSPMVVEAVKKFKQDHDDVEFYVVGKQEELQELVSVATVIDKRGVMGMEDGALDVMRRKDTSMLGAIDLVANGTCDGVVTAGSTGAFLTGATIKLKMIENVERSGLISPFPTVDGKGVIMLDIGANNENNPYQLKTFAKMGNVYSKIIMKRENPRVFLLSNGAEAKKGSPVGKQAYKLLEEDKSINFCGNIESKNVLTGEADVVVCEGYPGNVLLKSIEGTASFFKTKIKEAFTLNIFCKLGYLLARKGVKKMSDDFDYKKYGGAMLMGINGVAVKGHGNSDSYAFYNAIRVAYNMVKGDVVNEVKKAMKNG